MDRAGSVLLGLDGGQRLLHVLKPEGQLIRIELFTTGKELPTDVGFGRGADANLLSVTSGNGLYRIRLARAGYHLPAK